MDLSIKEKNIMVVLYHGTSSHFAKDIIANGLGTSKSDNKYINTLKSDTFYLNI